MMKVFLQISLILLLTCILCDTTIYNCDLTSLCGCGHTNVDITSRIIYGEEARPNSWSMIVSLTYFLRFDNDTQIYVCGGTILSDSYILTSANCLEGLNDNTSFNNLTISAGIHNRNESFQINRKVDNIMVYPSWTNRSNFYEHDIALVHLDEPLDFQSSSLITRTCLPVQLNSPEELIEYPPINTTLVIIGWGRTLHTADESDTLQQLIVYAMAHNDTACEDIITDPLIQFCAGRDDGGTGVCFGDFGGPVLQWMDNHWVQVGIISINRGGCELSSSEGYTRLSYYRNWIDSYILKLPNFTVTSTTPFKNNSCIYYQYNTLIMGIVYILIFIFLSD